MDQKLCQSCGMPLTEDVLGTNTDGTKNVSQTSLSGTRWLPSSLSFVIDLMTAS